MTAQQRRRLLLLGTRRGLILAGLLAACPSALAGTPPHYSLPDLVTANGYGAMVFAGDRLSDGYPHLYQQLSATSAATPDLLYDSYFGMVANGGGAWLTDVGSVDYEPGTGMIRVERLEPTGLELEMVEYDFAPMGLAGMGVAQVLMVRNVGSSTVSGAQIVSLHNWKVSTTTGGSELLGSPDATTITESGDDASLVYLADGSTDVSCAGVYDAVLAGQLIGGGCAASGADLAPSFGWRLPDLTPGAEVWLGVLSVDAQVDAAAWIAGRGAGQWVLDELAGWTAWQADNTVPEGMSAGETGVYAQQLAFLRMGQVQEPGDTFGQIPASLPVSASTGELGHIWNITWVRDGTYAAAALASAGRTDEAAAVLRFLSQGKTGEFRSYVGDADYLVSVCRVYGDGTEWSDSDADGPNVEFDDFGLYLWALGVLQGTGRQDLVDELGPPALDGVADVLIGLIDPNTGLLQPDSSIWERHWNGKQQQFAYSSIQAVAGLNAAASIADALGDRRAGTYREGAARIKQAIGEHLVSASGVIAASKEQLDEGDNYLDLAAVEAFNHDVLSPSGFEFEASYAAWQAGLRVVSGNGYARNDDGSTYDLHEWAVTDLRLAEALRRSGDDRNIEDAAAIEAWITDQAVLNHNTIPELFDPDDGNYAGPAPMLGFGAGAYVWGMNQRARIETEPPDGDSDAPDGQPQPCGCAGGAGGSARFGGAPSWSSSFWAALLVFGAVAQRRLPTSRPHLSLQRRER